MKYKTDEIQADWERSLAKGKPAFMRLYRVMLVIDALSQATGHGEITLTDFLRAQDFDSYHSIEQAGDISVKDKPRKWYAAMILFKWVLFRLDPQVQLVAHLELYGTDHRHIHVEIDTGDIRK